MQEIFNLRTAEELEELLNKFKVPAGKAEKFKRSRVRGTVCREENCGISRLLLKQLNKTI